MHAKYRTIWLLMVLVVWLTGCETTPVSSPGQKSAGVLSLTPAQTETYHQALAKLENNEPRAAEKMFAGLLRERTDVAEVWLNLALSQYHQNKLTETGITVKNILTAFPKTAQAHNLAGLVAVEQGLFKEAEQHYLDALKIKASYANALYNMALLQDIYLQNIPSSVEYYNRYLREVQDDEATKAWVENLSQRINR